MYSIPVGSWWLQSSMIALCVLVLAVVVAAIRSPGAGAVMTAWVVAVSVTASTGVLGVFDPPRVLFVLPPTLLGVYFVARRFSERLTSFPLPTIIAVQAFRVAVELIIHQAVSEGVAPSQMTWLPGLNQDILTGLSALIVAPLAHRLPKRALWVWNVVGLGLLLWVILVALLSMPTPLQQFEEPNVWVAFFPYIGLPVVLVSAALLGHLVLFAKLRQE